MIEKVFLVDKASLREHKQRYKFMKSYKMCKLKRIGVNVMT